jgi:hypothetical protein
LYAQKYNKNLSIQKVLPKDGAVSAETCTRKGDNTWESFFMFKTTIVWVHKKFSLKMAQLTPKHIEGNVTINKLYILLTAIGYFIVYVHFVGVLQTKFTKRIHGMESFKTCFRAPAVTQINV